MLLQDQFLGCFAIPTARSRSNVGATHNSCPFRIAIACLVNNRYLTITTGIMSTPRSFKWRVMVYAAWIDPIAYVAIPVSTGMLSDARKRADREHPIEVPLLSCGKD